MECFVIFYQSYCGEIKGAFHYAKLTGHRSVEIPEEKGTTFSYQIRV